MQKNNITNADVITSKTLYFITIFVIVLYTGIFLNTSYRIIVNPYNNGQLLMPWIGYFFGYFAMLFIFMRKKDKCI